MPVIFKYIDYNLTELDLFFFIISPNLQWLSMYIELLPSHVPTTGEDLIVVQESTTAEVSSVSWELTGYADSAISVLQTEIINSAHCSAWHLKMFIIKNKT